MVDFYIRPAVRADVVGLVQMQDVEVTNGSGCTQPAMLQLIKDLATYEKEPDAVKATPDLLEKNIFDDGFAHAFVAFEGAVTSPGRAIGIALYFFNFSTWTGRPGLYLEDLFVQPEHRAKGVGKALFAELGRVAQEKGCPRLDWSVLKWNEPSIRFYKEKLGATTMDEWMGMRLETEGISMLSTFKHK